MKLILDSGGVSHLARRDARTLALLRELTSSGFWPPTVPTAVLVECLSGRPGPDAPANQFLRCCDVELVIPVALARRCAALRHRAARGSAVDALTVGLAEPQGAVLTSDQDDLTALADVADGVRILPV